MAPLEISPRVLDAVDAAIAEARTGFLPSYIQRRSGATQSEVVETLAALVKRGDLEVTFEVRCPDGETYKRYHDARSLPIGETVTCERCQGDLHEFEVTEDDVFITYGPSADYALAIIRRQNAENAGREAPPKDDGVSHRVDPGIDTYTATRREAVRDVYLTINQYNALVSQSTTSVEGDVNGGIGEGDRHEVGGDLHGGIGDGPRVGTAGDIHGSIGDGNVGDDRSTVVDVGGVGDDPRTRDSEVEGGVGDGSRIADSEVQGGVGDGTRVTDSEIEGDIGDGVRQHVEIAPSPAAPEPDEPPSGSPTWLVALAITAGVVVIAAVVLGVLGIIPTWGAALGVAASATLVALAKVVADRQ